MKNISEIKNSVNVAKLQSTRTETVSDNIPERDLIIDLSSDIESCDNETSANKKTTRSEYNFEQDIEKLIELSKQFQTEYENEKAPSDAAVSDEYLCIPILSSNSLRKQKASESVLPINDRDNFYFSSRSSRKENLFDSRSNHLNKSFTPTIPHPGPFGTGIIRPSPKKHSCIQKSETTSSAKRSRRFGWSVTPYASRYYNFDRTHPDWKLVESGASMIPKRISKETTELIARERSPIITKPLLNKGLTWHEFFERCNVYSSKSFQSSYGDTQTITQTAVSELSTPKSTDNGKIRKHILPQLNIRAECCVQRIPEISIAPGGFKRTVNTNIKLVEIIYEEVDSKVETVGIQNVESSKQFEPENTEPLHLQSDTERPASLEVLSTDRSSDVNETKTSLTSSTTPSKNRGYDSSLEESISLNVSRTSALTSGLADHKMKARDLVDIGIQTQNVETFAAHRKEDAEYAEGRIITSSSDDSRVDYDEFFLQPQDVCQKIELPTFPTSELVQMVDEIFDTSSDAVNMSYKYIVKETSIQTDIVWQNITDLFKQQSKPMLEPASDAVEIEIIEPHAHPNTTYVKQFDVTLPTNIANEREKFYNRHLLQAVRPAEGLCRHNRLKKIKICSCLACKSNIRFSSMNIDRSFQQTSNDSSSSPVFITRPSTKLNLFPSERYKRMKQVQKEHFENDPRISRTLKKIYATARKNETTSSSSSDRYPQLNVKACDHSTSNDEVLEPDLYTFRDEMLLFGLQSCDEIQYSSHLLKTESSQDTSTSIGKHYAAENQTLLGKNLFCTNSEESSSCNSAYGQRVSQQEQCLLKDIENSGSDPSALSSLLSTSSLERKINEIRLEDLV